MRTKHPTTPTPGQTPKSRVISEGFKNATDGLVQGFTLGTGSALAHRAVGAIFSSSAPTHTEVKPTDRSDVCAMMMKEYMTCMKDNNDYETCTKFLEAFNKRCS